MSGTPSERFEISLTVNGKVLNQGDAVRTSDPGKLVLATKASAEILLFDLA